MRFTRLALGVIVPLALFAGCGEDAAPPGDGDRSSVESTVTGDDQTGDDQTGDDLDGSWIVTSGFLDGEPLALVEGRDVTMDIDGDSIGGTAACNSYGGSVEIGAEFELGGSFAVGELSWTEMGCEPEVMDLEQRFLEALLAVDSFELAGTLSLDRAGARTSLTFDRLAPVPTTDIVGTTWVLDTVIDGDAANTMPGMANATLTLNTDGTLSGSTGCRRLEGEWVVSGAEVLFASFSAIDDPKAGRCAPESERLDGMIVTVLGDGFTAEVDGRRLTVMSQGNAGLSYTAVG